MLGNIKNHALYGTWRTMICRCENPHHKSWKNYGGRGIQVCSRWRRDFWAFVADVGARPEGHTLDRYPNPDGNYEPGNVRWADSFEQAKTSRKTRLLAFHGEELSMREWARRTGIGNGTISQRIADGWSVEDALTRPSTPRSQRRTFQVARVG